MASPPPSRGARRGTTASDDQRRWDRRYRRAPHGLLFGEAPAPLLRELAPRLPRRGRALDVAAGEGQNAVWLARRGLQVQGIELSPVARGRARALAHRYGVSLRLRAADLRRCRLRRGWYDLITCFHYLARHLVDEIASALRPGGLVVLELATVRNLRLHRRPARRFLLEEGELGGWFPHLDTLLYREGVFDGHGQAQLVARRPPPGR